MSMLFWLFFILSGALTWVAYHMLNRNTGTDDEGDGGLPVDWTPPELDLPPGVTLPVGDGPEVGRLLEEEAIY